MEIEKGTTGASSNLRGLLLALCLLLALVIGHALGLPIPGLSNAINRMAKHNESASELTGRTDFASISWYEGAKEYVRAQDEHRSMQAPLLIYFHTDWCPYCKKLDRDIFPSDEVSQFMRSVVKVRINPEAGPDERVLADQFGVRGYPSVFIIPINSDAPTKIYPFKRFGETFVAVKPSEFVRACREASTTKTP